MEAVPRGEEKQADLWNLHTLSWCRKGPYLQEQFLSFFLFFKYYFGFYFLFIFLAVPLALGFQFPQAGN